MFVEAGLNQAEYRYLERTVYRPWRRALKHAGTYPVTVVAAADEIDRAAAAERDEALAQKLRAVSAAMRERRPEAPDGIPADIHALLLSRLGDIERYSLDDFREIPVPSGR